MDWDEDREVTQQLLLHAKQTHAGENLLLFEVGLDSEKQRQH